MECAQLCFAVRVSNLHKRFGNIEVLKGLSFEVYHGEIFGIVGPNGAGKTTLLRILAGLLKPTYGSVEVLAHPLPQRVGLVKRYTSYLPEESNLYGRLSGYENLKLFAMAYFGSKNVEEIVRLGVKISGLSQEDLRRRVETYSKGMIRRVAVAAALMVKPKLAILDEPTAGLDVISARYIREVIREFSRELGTTVVMSSHNMFEVGKVCDRVALIHSGKIMAIGRADEILSRSRAEDLEEAFVKIVSAGEGGG